MKALLINAAERTITEVQQNSLHDIYKLIGCTMIESPVRFPNRDLLYCDEEAWMGAEAETAVLSGFMLPGWSYAILGNGMIVGIDDEGNEVDCKSMTEDFANIIWRDHAYMWSQGEMMGLI